MDYLKIGKATELHGRDYKLYRVLEILPGFLSWSTLLFLLIFSYFYPVGVAFFIIAFDIYWLLLVFYLGVHLLSSYQKIKKNTEINWKNKLYSLDNKILKRTDLVGNRDIEIKLKWDEIIHLIIFPIACESFNVISQSIKAITETGYPGKNMILVLSVEERGGQELKTRAEAAKKKFAGFFCNFIITTHPDGLVGELKGKGANQSWAAKIVKEDLIDKEGLGYDKILASVFDIDTIVYPDYFHCLTYKFLTVDDPYRASYQPIPLYHNNVWQASFFARVAASSNTFWQMMQQIRQEKLATYSSHSMTWRALVDAGFWGKTMVSEDSRIFWHCFCHYNGDYRVEPLYYPVSMDVTMDDTAWQTAKNLYKQQRRWGWGVENVPYLLFNGIKRWPEFKKEKLISRIFVQLYGFHSWATNALIIGVIGWMPMLFGGDRFNATVLSTNLPVVTRILMTVAMSGLVLSAILSTVLLPKKPKKYGFFKYIIMFLQWLVLPFSIIIFGAIPGLDAQTRLMFGKYLGFFVTPKSR